MISDIKEIFEFILGDDKKHAMFMKYWLIFQFFLLSFVLYQYHAYGNNVNSHLKHFTHGLDEIGDLSSNFIKLISGKHFASDCMLFGIFSLAFILVLEEFHSKYNIPKIYNVLKPFEAPLFMIVEIIVIAYITLFPIAIVFSTISMQLPIVSNNSFIMFLICMNIAICIFDFLFDNSIRDIMHQITKLILSD